MHCYRIGDVDVILQPGQTPLAEDRWMTPFAAGTPAASRYPIVFRTEVMEPPIFAGCKVLQTSYVHELLETPRGLFLMNHWGNFRHGYGFWIQELYRSDTVTIYVNPKLNSAGALPVSRLISTVGLHGKLLQRGCAVFHAAYIDHMGMGILFAAPSQTGKSTQARLWEQYAGAETINGDRVLIGKRDSRWYAHGYPCCGSSQICINRSMPLRTIVVLQQGKENRVEEMTGSQKIRALVSGTEVYPWNTEEVQRAFALAEQLAAEVPVLRLVCRPDEQAVEVLQQYLERYAHENS